MQKDTSQHRVALLVLLASYTGGLIGWAWDYAEHLGTLQSALGQVPAHLLMQIGTISALATLPLLLPRARSLLPSYAMFVAGLVLFLVHPVAGCIVLLALSLAAAWRFWRIAGGRNAFLIMVAVGVAIVLGGTAIDWFWHVAHPGLGEEDENMIRVPGHVIQLVGFFVGTIGAYRASATRNTGVRARSAGGKET